MADTANIERTFVVIKPRFEAESLAVTETLFSELDERFDNFRGHTLISSFSFDSDWETWEMHPNGDEFVCLLCGEVEFVLRDTSGEKSVRLQEPGTFVIVPKNTWHTARVISPAKMMFFTPGEGTENRATPPV